MRNHNLRGGCHSLFTRLGNFHRRYISTPLLGVVLFLLLSMRVTAQGIGIMPMYDASAEDVGRQFTEQSTLMLFQELQAKGSDATLLNPGGIYLVSDIDLIRAMAQPLRIPAVLITSIRQVARPPRGKHGDWFIEIEASLLDVGSGNSTPLPLVREKVRPEDLVVETYHGHFWGTTGSRPFASQRIGKIAHTIIQQIVASLPSQAHIATPAKQIGTASTCPGSFRIVFPNQRLSKIYDLLIDGSEESIQISDGIAPLSLSSAPHLIMLHLADPPYKVPLQHLYLFNFVFDCAHSSLRALLQPGGGIDLSAQ
jgi:hypothetical protein